MKNSSYLILATFLSAFLSSGLASAADIGACLITKTDSNPFFCENARGREGSRGRS